MVKQVVQAAYERVSRARAQPHRHEGLHDEGARHNPGVSWDRRSEGPFLLETVIVALISGGVTLAGAIASNFKSRAVMEQKIDELTRRVEKHNCLVERTYLLERDMALLKNDVEGLERKAGKDE